MANHLQEIEQTLRELIAKNDAEAIVVWVKERVLESYRNGMAARRGAGARSPRGARSFKRSYNGAREGFNN